MRIASDQFTKKLFRSLTNFFKMGGAGSHGETVKPERGLLVNWFRRIFGGPLTTEEDIVNWFKEKGIDNIGHVEINPQPQDYLNDGICREVLEKYAECIRNKECDEIYHPVYLKMIERICAIRIVHSTN